MTSIVLDIVAIVLFTAGFCFLLLIWDGSNQKSARQKTQRRFAIVALCGGISCLIVNAATQEDVLQGRLPRIISADQIKLLTSELSSFPHKVPVEIVVVVNGKDSGAFSLIEAFKDAGWDTTVTHDGDLLEGIFIIGHDLSSPQFELLKVFERSGIPDMFTSVSSKVPSESIQIVVGPTPAGRPAN